MLVVKASPVSGASRNGSSALARSNLRRQVRWGIRGPSKAASGVGLRSNYALVDKASGKQEPGYVPPSMLRIQGKGEQGPDKWAALENRGQDQYSDKWKLTIMADTFGVTGNSLYRQWSMASRIVPYSNVIDNPLPGLWAEHISDVQKLPPQGIEWKDPDAGTLNNYAHILQGTPEGQHLHPHLCSALKSLGIKTLTRPQAESLYYLNRGRDMYMTSAPGSGKTSAAVWHVLNKLLKEYPNAPFSTLWVCPTESLARQTLRWFHTLGKMAGVIDEKTYALCIDSKDITKNFDELMQNRPSVLIGTPNRLGELLHSPNTPLADIEVNTISRVVVDELDEVMPVADKDALGTSLMFMICQHKRFTPTDIKIAQIQSQKIFLTATPEKETHELANRFMKIRTGARVESHIAKYGFMRPGWIGNNQDMGEEVQDRVDLRRLDRDGNDGKRGFYGGLALPADIDHLLVVCSGAGRNGASVSACRYEALAASVRGLCDGQNAQAASDVKKGGRGVFFRGLIVVASGAEAKKAAAALYKKGFEGRVGRLENPVALQSYADGQLPILISTPRFVRGMDLPNLTHVFTALPGCKSQDYHRIAGRVGRTGTLGVSVAVVLPGEVRAMRETGHSLRFEWRTESTADLGVSFEGLALAGASGGGGGASSETAPARVEEQLQIAEAPRLLKANLPLSRFLRPGESREVNFNKHVKSSTAETEVSLTKAFLVDDPKAVDSFIEPPEGESIYFVHELRTLDKERNYYLADGTVKPMINPKAWPAGATPGIFYNDDEKTEIHKQNIDEYMARPQTEDVKTLDPNLGIRQPLSGRYAPPPIPHFFGHFSLRPVVLFFLNRKHSQTLSRAHTNQTHTPYNSIHPDPNVRMNMDSGVLVQPKEVIRRQSAPYLSEYILVCLVNLAAPLTLTTHTHTHTHSASKKPPRATPSAPSRRLPTKTRTTPPQNQNRKQKKSQPLLLKAGQRESWRLRTRTSACVLEATNNPVHTPSPTLPHLLFSECVSHASALTPQPVHTPIRARGPSKNGDPAVPRRRSGPRRGASHTRRSRQGCDGGATVLRQRFEPGGCAGRESGSGSLLAILFLLSQTLPPYHTS